MKRSVREYVFAAIKPNPAAAERIFRRSCLSVISKPAKMRDTRRRERYFIFLFNASVISGRREKRGRHTLTDVVEAESSTHFSSEFSSKCQKILLWVLSPSSISLFHPPSRPLSPNLPLSPSPSFPPCSPRFPIWNVSSFSYPPLLSPCHLYSIPKLFASATVFCHEIMKNLVISDFSLQLLFVNQ